MTRAVAVVVVVALFVASMVVGLVLALAAFVAFVDADRSDGSVPRAGRLGLQAGAVTFVVGLVATYLVARLDGAWAVVVLPVVAVGVALMARGERARHRIAEQGGRRGPVGT